MINLSDYFTDYIILINTKAFIMNNKQKIVQKTLTVAVIGANCYANNALRAGY